MNTRWMAFLTCAFGGLGCLTPAAFGTLPLQGQDPVVSQRQSPGSLPTVPTLEQRQAIEDIISIRKQLGGGLDETLKDLLDSNQDLEQVFRETLTDAIDQQPPKPVESNPAGQRVMNLVISQASANLLGDDVDVVVSGWMRVNGQQQIRKLAETRLLGGPRLNPTTQMYSVNVLVNDEQIERITRFQPLARISVIPNEGTTSKQLTQAIQSRPEPVRDSSRFSPPALNPPRPENQRVLPPATGQPIPVPNPGPQTLGTRAMSRLPQLSAPYQPPAIVGPANRSVPPVVNKPTTRILSQGETREVRRISRVLDQLASELEDLDLYDSADNVREMAQNLRQQARRSGDRMRR